VALIALILMLLVPCMAPCGAGSMASGCCGQ